MGPFSDAAALVDHVTELVVLPEVYLRVQQLLNDSNTSAADIGRIINTDPVLTARLLKIANSPYFGMAARIDTIGRAVAIMGTQHLHDFLLATSVTSAFVGLPEPRPDLNRFWLRSTRCAIIARLIAIDCNVLGNERVFVAGLLNDIGHLVMYQLMPGPTAEAEACAEAQGRSLAAVERELFFGYDYADVGSLLLQRWNLPPMLSEIIRHHNEPEQAQRFSLETAIVHAARIISSVIEKRDPAADALPLIDSFATQQTQLNKETLDDIEITANRQLTDTVNLLLPNLSAA